MLHHRAVGHRGYIILRCEAFFLFATFIGKSRADACDARVLQTRTYDVYVCYIFKITDRLSSPAVHQGPCDDNDTVTSAIAGTDSQPQTLFLMTLYQFSVIFLLCFLRLSRRNPLIYIVLGYIYIHFLLMAVTKTYIHICCTKRDGIPFLIDDLGRFH